MNRNNTEGLMRKIYAEIRRNPIMGLGVLGLAGAILFTFTYGRPKPPPPNQLSMPASSPFEKTVSGSGIVEANTRNIKIGSNLTGVVIEVNVKEGDEVKKGDVLLKLDDRSAAADVNLKEKEANAAEANVGAAKAQLNEADDQYKRVQALKTDFAISTEERRKRQFGFDKAKAQFAQAEALFEQEKADLEMARVTLEKLTIRAPVDGTILKVQTKIGEFISAGLSGSQNLMIMGGTKPLHLRVQIDENDVWRYEKDAPAKAFLKSNKEINFPLTLVRVEPYAQSKQQLSGDSTEKVDTRVLEVVYKIDGDSKNLVIGQQLDVFVEASKGP